MEVDTLLMRWPPRGEAKWMVALPMRMARDGIILAIPCGVIPPETLREGETDPMSLVGPHSEVSVGVDGERDRDVQLQVALVEFKSEVRSLLEVRPSRTKKTVVGFGEDPAQMPDLIDLFMACQEWIEGGHLRSDGYVTAVPEEVEGAADGEISKQLQLMREMMEQRLEVLETSLVTLQSHPLLRSKPVVRPGKPSGSLDGEMLGEEEERAILETVRSQVKPAPVRMSDQPGTRKDTLVPVPALEGLADPPENLTLDQLMKAQLCHPNDARKDGQEKQKGEETPRTPQLGGFPVVRRRRRNLVIELKGGKRDRGCGTASTCNGATSSTLPRSHGAEDGQVCGNVKVGCQHSGEVYPRSASGQKQNSRILSSRVRRSAPPDDFGRNGSSKVAHLAHDGGSGAIPDRRKLASRQSSYGTRRAAMERMGDAGFGDFEETVCLLEAGGTNMGRSAHQPTERRRVADQEKKQCGATYPQAQRWWKRQGDNRGSECKLGGRVRKQRFLRFSLDGGQGNLRDGTGPGAGVSEMSEWLQSTVRFLMNSDLPIGRYVRSTCRSELGSSQAGSRELFACPPPFAWVAVKGDSLSRSRRARVRRKARRAVELLTNLMVCALSHQAIGCEIAPLRGRCGVELNASQTKMVEHLSALASSLVRHGAGGSSCGLRMPATGDRLSRLREQLGECADIPYARAAREFKARNGDSAFTATQALPVIADRLSLPEQVTDFDPRPYLSDVFRQVYENPDDFLKPEGEMPEPIRTKGTASREEFLKVMGRWDQLGRLFVCKASDVNSEDRCELFSVAKDQDKDRQILHRKKRNRREIHLPGASRFLPHGVLLSQLWLGDEDVCVASVDDVKDFYRAYSASESRARSSPVGPTLAVREISHLVACKDALKRKAISYHDQVVCCFKGLGMGDHVAVDIAQESHVNLLKSFGAMRDDESLSYRSPLPRPVSGFFEGVMIDDHLGLQILPRRKTLKQAGRDQEVFAAASRAYDTTGLIAHEKKQVRRSLHATVWGAEIEGLVGLSGPFRRRLYKLAQLSIEAAKPGGVDQKISEALTGLWAFNAQFRRPMFSFIYDLYHQQSPGGSNEPFNFTRGARNELCVLAMLAPLCVSDLRVPYDPYVYNVDASPSGAGVCRAKVGSRISQEIWRRGDKLGYNAPLLSSLKSALKGSGFDEELLFSSDEDTEVCETLPPRAENNSPRIKKSSETELDRQELQRVLLMAKAQKILPDRVHHTPDLVPFDFLELYSGCGHMTQAWIKRGFTVLPPIELRGGHDMRDQNLLWAILGLARAGKIRCIWWAPPCTTFSLARTPKLRSLKKAWGFLPFEIITAVGNLHASQSLLLAMVQIMVGHWMAGEQPAFGFMRGLICWTFLKLLGVLELRFDWCRFGQPFKKTTCLLTNIKPLEKIQKRCCHKQKHPKLEGQRTTQAGAYSMVFCDQVAELCAQGWLWNDTPKDPETPKHFEGNVCGKFEGNRLVDPRNPKSLKGVFGKEKESFGNVAVEKKSPSVPTKGKNGSPLWSVQLSEGLEWKTWVQFQFRRVIHINLQESKARRALVKRLLPNQRVVVGQDSRVNLGAFSKGRSPSKSLNDLLRSEAPYVLGKNLYLSGIHMPTWSIRSDAPSRRRKVEPPRTPLPVWFWPLLAGKVGAHHGLDHSEGLPRAVNRWFLLGGAMLLRACRSDGPQTCQDHGAHSGAIDGGPGTGGYYESEESLVRRLRAVVAGTEHLGQPRGNGQTPRGCVYRVARRVHDLHVHQQKNQKGCSRNFECVGPTLRMASPDACRAVEHLEDMGPVRTGGSPSTLADCSSSCSCGYCFGVGMASLCGGPGVSLFWAIEAFRVAGVAQARHCTAHGSPRTGSALPSHRTSQNKNQRSSKPTCSDRRTRHSGNGATTSEGNVSVAKDLEWVLECL